MSSTCKKYLLIYNSEKENKVFSEINNRNIFLIKENFITPDNCGQVSPTFFNPSLSFISESKNCNSCLNKKVAIDENGLVKNCLSQKESYGFINEINLAKLLKNEQFKSFGNINKDTIEVCKDCEFRYICSDCRINTENSKNILSKPKYCNYDPYTNTWN